MGLWCRRCYFVVVFIAIDFRSFFGVGCLLRHSVEVDFCGGVEVSLSVRLLVSAVGAIFGVLLLIFNVVVRVVSSAVITIVVVFRVLFSVIVVSMLSVAAAASSLPASSISCSLFVNLNESI